MVDHPEDQGFRPIGSHLPKTETLPPRSSSIQTRSPPSSGITGQALRAATASSSIGREPIATDAANSLPEVRDGARYSALDRQQESPRALRTRFDRGRENRTRIAAHISRHLSHFWAANEDSRLRAAIAQDWLADMGEFHESVVAEACQEWRRAETKRPTIADIRKLCMEATHAPEQGATPRAVHDGHAAEQLAEFNEQRYREAAESREAAARERGFDSFKQAMAYGLKRAGLA